MTLVAFWGFLKKVPYWVWLILGGIILGWAFVEAQKAEAVRKNNEKRDREAREVEDAVLSNIQENTDAVIAEADAVREHTSASVMPNGGATLSEANYRD